MNNNEINDIKLTKVDLLHLIQHTATREDIGQLRSEVKADNIQLRNEMNENNIQLRNELKEEITQLRNEMNYKFNYLEQKMFVKKDAYLMFGFGVFILLCMGYFATDKLALLIQLIKTLH